MAFTIYPRRTRMGAEARDETLSRSISSNSTPPRKNSLSEKTQAMFP